MAEHADDTGRNAPDTSSDVEGSSRQGKPGVDWAAVKDQSVGLLAAVVRWIGLIFALILVVHIIFTIADANPENGIVQFINSWADPLTLGFQDLFQPEDENLRTLINYGVAAIFWLIVSSLGSRLIRRIGGMSA
ncbi:MAG: hypothetical protein ACRDQW_12950 [Haloechinothrix sp.]